MAHVEFPQLGTFSWHQNLLRTQSDEVHPLAKDDFFNFGNTNDVVGIFLKQLNDLFACKGSPDERYIFVDDLNQAEEVLHRGRQRQGLRLNSKFQKDPSIWKNPSWLVRFPMPTATKRG